MMLSSDPAMSAAEALVSLHSAPFHQLHDVVDSTTVTTLPAASASHHPRSSRDRHHSDLPVTDKHMDWQQSPSTLSEQRHMNADRIMDWQASVPADDGSYAASLREQNEEAHLGLALRPLDGLTGDIAGRFDNLRTDLMAVDGSMDLDNYLLSTYDIHAPTYKDTEDRGKKQKDADVNPSVKSKAAGGGHARGRKTGHAIKLKPLNEINLLRSARRLAADSGEDRVPLPSIRAILAGRPPVHPSKAHIAPAAGPHSRADPVHYGPYRMPETPIPIDAATGRPFLLPHMTHGRIISDAPDGRPAGHPRGTVVRTAPVPAGAEYNLPRTYRYLQSAPSGTALDPTLSAIRASDHRSISGTSGPASVPPKRIVSRASMTGAPVVAPVEEIVHRQQHHIQELHQQNVWLQQQLLAQTAASQQQQQKPLMPAPPAGADGVVPSQGRRRSCTPCPHHKHSHADQASQQPQQPQQSQPQQHQASFYRHSHGMTTTTPVNPHKKKPYSLPDQLSASHVPRTSRSKMSTTSTAANTTATSVLTPSAATTASAAPTGSPTPHLPSPTPSSISPSNGPIVRDAHPPQYLTRTPAQQQQQQQQPQQGGHRQTIAKLGEFLRKGSFSGAASGGGERHS
ncbi:hypothetical protein HKX48_005332 [Thoreauomyces humboldtii]|nr:hypothetical protein HKX48_005332 [Thoreauomyces humboldtii]